MPRDEDSVPARGRPNRRTSKPARFQQTGGLGAACGHGNVQQHAPRASTGRSSGPPGVYPVGRLASATASDEDAPGGSCPLELLGQAAVSVQRESGTASGRSSRADSDQQQRTTLRRPADVAGDEAGDSDGSDDGGNEEGDYPLDHTVTNTPSLTRLLNPSDEEGEEPEGATPQRNKSTGRANQRGGGGGVQPAAAVQSAAVQPAVVVVAAPSAPAASATTNKRSLAHKLKSSARKAIDSRTEYREWPAFLLQRLCRMRGLKGCSSEKNPEVLANKLKGLDDTRNRSSPYYGDMHAFGDAVRGCPVGAAHGAWRRLWETDPGMQGKLEEADLLYKRALAIYEKMYGPDRQEVANTLHERAGVLQDQIARVTNDDFAAHTDLNILSQPDITVQKLKAMYATLWSKFNTCYARKTGSESGTHAQWEDFCQRYAGFIDVVLNLVFRFNELLQMIDQAHPEDLQREDDSTGGVDGPCDFGDDCEGDSPPTGAARRVITKRKGREMHATSRDAKSSVRKTARRKETEETATAISAGASTITLKWGDITEKAESENAQFLLRLRQMNANAKCSEELQKALAKDPSGTSFQATFLKNALQRQEAAMKNALQRQEAAMKNALQRQEAAMKNALQRQEAAMKSELQRLEVAMLPPESTSGADANDGGGGSGSGSAAAGVRGQR